MEFIKQMKKREFIEMSLKAFASILALFLAFILMECMIYGIELKALTSLNGNSSTLSDSTIAYCIKQDDNQYFVLFHDKSGNLRDTNNEPIEWTANQRIYTEEECTKELLTVKEVVFEAPSAFELETVKGFHFIILGVLVAAVGGYFTYRFVRLGQSYKRIEEQFLKDGTIEIANA